MIVRYNVCAMKWIKIAGLAAVLSIVFAIFGGDNTDAAPVTCAGKVDCFNVTWNIGAGTPPGTMGATNAPSGMGLYTMYCIKPNASTNPSVGSDCHAAEAGHEDQKVTGVPSRPNPPVGMVFDRWEDSRGYLVTNSWVVTVNSTFYARYVPSSTANVPNWRNAQWIETYCPPNNFTPPALPSNTLKDCLEPTDEFYRDCTRAAIDQPWSCPTNGKPNPNYVPTVHQDPIEVCVTYNRFNGDTKGGMEQLIRFTYDIAQSRLDQVVIAGGGFYERCFDVSKYVVDSSGSAEINRNMLAAISHDAGLTPSQISEPGNRNLVPRGVSAEVIVYVYSPLNSTDVPTGCNQQNGWETIRLQWHTRNYSSSPLVSTATKLVKIDDTHYTLELWPFDGTGCLEDSQLWAGSGRGPDHCKTRTPASVAWLVCPAGDALSKIIDWFMKFIEGGLRWEYLIPGGTPGWG